MVALPPVIGAFVRVAGVWERAQKGTPEGFAGVAVHSGSVFVNTRDVYGYASGFQVVWTSIDGELNAQDRSVFKFLFIGTPKSAEAGLAWRPDGSIDEKKNVQNAVPGGFTTFNIDNWRQYDMTRDYEIKFDFVSGDHVTVEPTLNTWLNLTSPAASHELTARLFNTTGDEEGTYDIRFREKISAPASGNDIMRSTVSASVV